jgi:hypothetical protein
VDRKDIKSIEEILTERPGIDRRSQIAVRCGQHSHVNGKRLAAADAFKLSLLQHAKQGDLRLDGKIANLIQEYRAAIRRFKASNAPL